MANIFRFYIARPLFPVLFFLALIFMVGSANAHKVNMFAHVEGGKVTVEGYFSDGKPAEKSQIQVFSPSGERLLTGTADDDGVFAFDVPQISDLRITLYAGMGHRAEYTVPEAELAGAAAAQNGTGSTVEGAGGTSPASVGVAADEIDAVVRKAVGEALHPVMRNLSELKEQRTFSDIMGGIGFIFGLIGIFFYLKARKTAGPSAGTKADTGGASG